MGRVSNSFRVLINVDEETSDCCSEDYENDAFYQKPYLPKMPDIDEALINNELQYDDGVLVTTDANDLNQELENDNYQVEIN